MRTLSIIALSSIALASSVEAAQILSFEAGPISPGVPELSYLGGLVSGPGSFGNADGIAPPNTQIPGGLTSSTPFVIPGVPGGVVNPGGSTTFYDTTLILTGNAAAGPASTLFGVIIGQLTGAGTFDLYSTSPGGPALPVLLLSGTITTGAIGGFSGGSTASFQSTSITYTGGLIYNALTAGGHSTTGELSVSMIDVTPALTESRGVLLPFDANASGLFSAVLVPEPTSLGMICLGAAAALRRRSR